MSFYDQLVKHAEALAVEEGETSYFSKPGDGLDPKLFKNGRLAPYIRTAILTLLINHLELGYAEPTAWASAYLAGSGVSYNWEAHRDPGDLDCLVSVDYVKFRMANQEYKGWSDAEISAEINQGFKNELLPRTENFMESYELTFYVNVNPHIEEIKPYAAYSITDDTWVVPPTQEAPPVNPEWDTAIERDRVKATEVVKRYATALEQIKNAANTAMRVNAESALATAVQQGAALFEDIHESRSTAFSPSGQGYADYANYRWQSGKRSGVVPAMKRLHAISNQAGKKFATETYGVELPDTATLIRRAYRAH